MKTEFFKFQSSLRFVCLLIFIMLFSSCSMIFPIKRYKIPQNGMYPNVYSGCITWTRKNPYNTIQDITRGDIIVFKKDYKGKVYNFIWRVIGLPGDRVILQDTSIMINGERLGHNPLPESDPESLFFMESVGGLKYLVAYEKSQMMSARKEINITVPVGEVFVLGDNRDHALDSRFLGTVQFNSIIAKAIWPEKIECPPKSTYDFVLERHAHNLLTIPEYRKLAESFSSQEEAERIGKVMVNKGLVRLDDDTLLIFFSLLNKILSDVDPPICAAFFSGKGSLSQGQMAIRKLDLKSFKMWLDITTRAMISELRKEPSPTLSDTEKKNAIRSFAGTLSPDQLVQIRPLVSDSANEVRTCAALKIVLNYIVTSDDPYRKTVMRFVAEKMNTE